MSELLVRRADGADAEMIIGIEARSFGPGSWGADNVREGLVAPYVRAFVCFDGARPAGFAMWRGLGEEGEILSIGVEPDLRRRGCGQRLLDAVLADAAGEAVCAMFLEVNAGNSAARGLYERNGFRRVGLRPRYYPDGGDALVMRREV